MDAALFKTLGQIAGIGGVSLGVFLLLFRKALQKVLLSRLTTQQSYSLIKLFLILVWSVALVGMGLWAYTGQASSKETTTFKVLYELPDDVVQAEVRLFLDGEMITSLYAVEDKATSARESVQVPSSGEYLYRIEIKGLKRLFVLNSNNKPEPRILPYEVSGTGRIPISSGETYLVNHYIAMHPDGVNQWEVEFAKLDKSLQDQLPYRTETELLNTLEEEAKAQRKN